ncbi:MAG: 50S ribosomal protein L17, partial [Clostridia bacterium]|nr:50S ribosomal protein L17 [Clostridia bacterium]
MRKLGRTTDQRKAMLRGMVTLLLETGKITTTYTRAQEVSAKVDEMITLGKKGDLAA